VENRTRGYSCGRDLSLIELGGSIQVGCGAVARHAPRTGHRIKGSGVLFPGEKVGAFCENRTAPANPTRAIQSPPAGGNKMRLGEPSLLAPISRVHFQRRFHELHGPYHPRQGRRAGAGHDQPDHRKEDRGLIGRGRFAAMLGPRRQRARAIRAALAPRSSEYGCRQSLDRRVAFAGGLAPPPFSRTHFWHAIALHDV
jgi:hypothetical protein